MGHRYAAAFFVSTLALLLTAAVASRSSANPVAGFIEEFPASNGVGTFTGGSVLANPGSGGFLGGTDGYLKVSTPAVANFGTNSSGPEYTGDWIAAGVDEVRLRLNDIGTDEAFEIHFLIGNALNLWSYNVGFAPPNGSWGEFIVPLNGPTGWTRTIGTGTFSDAIKAVDRILIRHDKPPFVQTPDQIKGDLGIDHIALRNSTATPTTESSWGRIKRLYR
jgi:hypothetical protein